VPASALFLSVGNDTGASFVSALELYRSESSTKEAMNEIDQVLSLLGGTEGAIGWIGDAGVVVNQAAAGVEGGLIVLPTDRAAADRIFTNLHNLISLGGAQFGIVVTDVPYGSATITTVDFGDISSLAALAGVPPETLGMAPGMLTGHIELAYSITDQVVVIGSGSEFVKHVLDTTPGTSLASNDRFEALVSRIGPGTGVTFLDIAAIRGSMEGLLPILGASATAEYEESVKPFLAPFDALIASGSFKGDVTTGKVIITVH
jgi:hypothetical protein